MYGIKAPGAESLSPLKKFIKLIDIILYLFFGGLEKLCRASTPSRSSSAGLVGLLISRSFRGAGPPDEAAGPA